MCVFQPKPIPIICKESGSLLPPFVDPAPRPAVLTFGDFRHRFAIPSPNNKRVFFKQHILGESFHFKWEEIKDDRTVLPIFNGHIVAEVQTLSEVEYLRRQLEDVTEEKEKLQRALDKAKKLLKATRKAAQETNTNIADFLKEEQDDEDEQNNEDEQDDEQEDEDEQEDGTNSRCNAGGALV